MCHLSSSLSLKTRRTSNSVARQLRTFPFQNRATVTQLHALISDHPRDTSPPRKIVHVDPKGQTATNKKDGTRELEIIEIGGKFHATSEMFAASKSKRLVPRNFASSSIEYGINGIQGTAGVPRVSAHTHTHTHTHITRTKQNGRGYTQRRKFLPDSAEIFSLPPSAGKGQSGSSVSILVSGLA